MPVGRGIKKVNENVFTNGRGIIVTEQDKNQYNWADIPVGSKLINTKDGTEYVKLEGESDWVPSKIRNDGTLNIAKDSIIKKEIFTIIDPDEGDGNFSYSNTLGQVRHMPISNDGYVFELEEGSYAQFRNHLEVKIDDVLTRDTISGGLIEINYHRFAVTDVTLESGQEITATYYKVIRIGNPYPRFFYHKNEPEDGEIGDFWLDVDATLAEVDCEELRDESTKTLPWTRVSGKPDTLSGYGLYDEVTKLINDHVVPWSKISGIPTPPTNIDAYTLQGHLPGLNAGNILLIPNTGRLPESLMPLSIMNSINTVNSNFATLPKIFIQDGQPAPVAGGIWFCTASGSRRVCVCKDGANWLSLSEVWQ